MTDFSGKVALVTGGGGARGIGEAICTKLAEYGAAVAVTDVNFSGAQTVAADLSRRGFRALPFEHDVTSWDQSQRVANDVALQLGGIDILVNNAGVSAAVNFLELSEAEWNRVLGINLGGVFNTCRAVLPAMVSRGKGGRVINIASIAAKVAMPGLAAYCTSKFAILGLTQAIASEMARYDITVNTVCPGVVETPLHDKLMENMIASGVGPTSVEDVAKWMNNRMPLGRPQTAADVAEMVAFLASDNGRNLTAASYHVDGGLVPR